VRYTTGELMRVPPERTWAVELLRMPCRALESTSIVMSTRSETGRPAGMNAMSFTTPTFWPPSQTSDP